MRMVAVARTRRAARAWLMLGSTLLVALACSSCSGKRNVTSASHAIPSQAVDQGPGLATSGASADGASPAAPDPPATGVDFTAQAKELFRIAACGGEGPVDPKFDSDVVAAHCEELHALIDEYKKSWVEVAMPYLAQIVPHGLPPAVVYPFGGGDLLGALATFPDAAEYTTISLEAAGDARKVDAITPKQLKAELALNRLHLSKLFEKAHSQTINLTVESKGDLPGEVIFALVALAVHGYEPTYLRYFSINPDGTLHYLEEADIAQLEKDKAAKGQTKEAADLEVFKNMELGFQRAGDPHAPLKVLRHIAFNLDDQHMRADPSLQRHLASKGKVAAMTKAASHFLWSDGFSIIRAYLLDHMDWMISDSTGVPPRLAMNAGFVQDTYGQMSWPAAFGRVDNRDAEDLRRLFKNNPQKDLPFRYGYPDRDHHGHIVITRRAKT